MDRVYYNNGYSTNNGYNNTYRSYRPAYPGTYNSSPARTTTLLAPITSILAITTRPTVSYYGGYGNAVPYYGTPSQQRGRQSSGTIVKQSVETEVVQ